MAISLFCSPVSLRGTLFHVHLSVSPNQGNFCPHPNDENEQGRPLRRLHRRSAHYVHAKLPSILTARNNIVPRLVPLARNAWYTLWRLFMAQLAPSDASGRYIRPSSSNTTQSSPSEEETEADPDDPDDRDAASVVIKGFAERDDATFPVVYVGLACPWCHRVLLSLALTGLISSHDVRYVKPATDGLWKLSNPEQNASRLKDVYFYYDAKYKGRFTAPLYINRDLFAMSNESSDILRIIASLAKSPRPLPRGAFVSLYPSSSHMLEVDDVTQPDVDPPEMEQLSKRIHTHINDGVYKCGFATSQLAYDEAVLELFDTLDEIEGRLKERRFLCSNVLITDPDIKLFPTVFRFDGVYALIFRVYQKSIRADYPNISRWMRDIYNMPGVKETCDLEQTRNSYFQNLFPLNPSAIVPQGPDIDFSPLEDHELLALSNK